MRPLRTEHPESAGQYRLEACLGTGGMGVVHLASSGSGLRLAVKVVHAEHAADPEFRARFRQEVAAARRVSGAFTAPVVDADPDAERPWMATLFIEGPTLAERIKRNGPMGADELRRVGAGLAEALRDIHRAGVVHRDLKPSNVLLAADGPKVIDFGISRPYDSDLRTETGKLIGTPPFMAPEQFQRPRDVGPAADVFALGAVLTHAATGRGPFDSDSPYIVAYQVVHNEPDLAGVPEGLAPVLRACLAKDPADRPTADEVMVALRSPAAHPHTQSFRVPDVVREEAGAGAEPWAGAVAVDGAGAVDEAGAGAAPRQRWPWQRQRRRGVGVAVLGCAVVGAAVAALLAVGGGDGGDRRDGVRSEGPARAGAAFRPWEVSFADGRTAACAAPSDGGLFCTAPGVAAVRLDPADGRTLWSARSGGRGRASEEGMAPVLCGGLLHTVPSGSHRLEALDPGSGKVGWSADVSAYPSVSYAGDVVLLSGRGGLVRALDGRTGKELWTRRGAGDGTRWVAARDGEGALLAVTAAADGASTRVVSVGPGDGRTRWEKRLTGLLEPAGAGGGALVLLSADSDGYTDGVVRLGLADRSVRRLPLGAPVDQAQAAVDGDRVYLFGAGGSLVAVDAAAGRQLWRRETSVARASRPVAAGGRVYLVAADGRLLAVDARRGVLLGQTKLRMGSGSRTYSAALPMPAVADGRVFATAPDGSVFAVGADPARW
ncbi:PQQ-binding-like beta-propeller repeat protein [Streptomyces sp. NPDC050504]|uniref:protein kinase domain-containing protein n=1 Tax=Streptomyces sp. NPDC050504 TaxID=3365618 RepID=UPI0037951FA1